MKPIDQQTIVITGASSGIGRTTAQEAAKWGAKLVLAARSEGALRELVQELEALGGEAIYVVGDVGNEEDVRRISREAIERFGGFDTWVNNAGVSIYGPLEQVPTEDSRRLFDTNFWGVVYGSLTAVEHLRQRGGTLINIGSALSDRAIPLQGMYSASKHAVRGFTDALRMELEKEGAPVAVTLIKPGTIDTPYTEHAKNFLDEEPRNPPPVYAPEVVAEAILHCAEQPRRDLYVGAGGKGIASLGDHAPRLTDWVMERSLFEQQRSGRSPRNPSGGLHHASGGGGTRSNYPYNTRERSLYTQAELHPLTVSLLGIGVGLAVAALLRAARS